MGKSNCCFLVVGTETGGRVMEDQVTIPDVREAIKMAREITPIMNNTEYTTLMIFYNQVLNRYQKEVYPDGLPEED